MKQTTILLLAALLILPTTALLAEEEVPPPPATIHDEHAAHSSGTAGREEGNLEQELTVPDNGKTGEEPEVRVRQRADGAKIEEYAIKGKIYMVRVSPGGGAPAYYLYDNDGDGVFERRLSGGVKHISPPSWVIKRF